MSSPSEQQQPIPETNGELQPGQLVDIRITGPSEELRNGILFPGIPKSITIGQLKERISAELPSHPPAHRQRLIYLGRALQPDTEKLSHYFGENIVRVSLHCCNLDVDARLLNGRDFLP